MSRSRLSVSLYLLLVFLSGALVGALGYRAYVRDGAPPRPRPSPEEFRRRYMEDMRSRLKLSQEQVKRIDAILDETRDRYRAQMRAMQEEQSARIRAVLDPAQQKEYEKMRQEREERRKRAHKQGPGPEPPGGR